MSFPMTTVGTVLRGIVAGKSVQTLERPAVDGELGILKVSAVTWGEFRADENKAVPADYDPGDCPRPMDGDILISRANTRELVGAPVMVQGSYPNLLLSDKLLKLIPDNKLIDRRFLLRALRSEEATSHFFKCAGGSSGSMTNITQSDIRSAPIPLPPLLEQRRIAAILDKADALRAKRRAALAQLDRLAQSIFLEMFGDPVANPKGWPNPPLAEVSARIQIGPFGSQLHEEDYIEGGIPLVNPTHIRHGRVVPDWSLTVPEAKCRELEQYHLAEGDLILGRRGEMGRCAVISVNEHGWLCGTGSLFVRPDRRAILSAYLGAAISSKSMRRHLENAARGVTMANLNKDIVGALPIALPPLELQREYLSRIGALEKLAEQQRASQSLEHQLFSSLQHRAFRGEL